MKLTFGGLNSKYSVAVLIFAWLILRNIHDQGIHIGNMTDHEKKEGHGDQDRTANG